MGRHLLYGKSSVISCPLNTRVSERLWTLALVLLVFNSPLVLRNDYSERFY